MSEDDMKLPEGKTCGDCVFYSWCEAIIQCAAENKECDWSPSRFREKENADETQTSIRH